MSKTPLSNPEQLIEAFYEMLNAALDYQKIKEAETTNRAVIEKEKQEALEKIRSQKEILLHIVETKHNENMMVIRGYLDNLDKAIMSNNAPMVGLILSGISDTLKNNPFASIRDMTDVNGRLQIEI